MRASRLTLAIVSILFSPLSGLAAPLYPDTVRLPDSDRTGADIGPSDADHNKRKKKKGGEEDEEDLRLTTQ